MGQQECRSEYWEGLLDYQMCAFFQRDDGSPAAVRENSDIGGPLFSDADEGKAVQVRSCQTLEN